MKKGFALTLIAVAIALIQVSAVHATAPVITDPGDVIVGDLPATPPATGTNVFVFPDAFNLGNIVNDDDTDDADIKWSFLDTSGRYTINGVSSLDASLSGLGADDPTSPRAASRIDLNNSDLGEPSTDPESDGDAQTVTVRNVELSPDNTPAAEPDVTGIIDGTSTSPGDQTSVITLYASDCTTFSSLSIIVYTANNTSDSLSGDGGEPVLAQDFTGGNPVGPSQWIGGQLFQLVGTSVDDTPPGGLCMTSSAAADGAAGWFSPVRYFDIAADTVYRTRFSVTTDQQGTDAQPLWFHTVDNFIGAGLGNNFGVEQWILDVDGGAQGIGAGGSVYDFFWAPNFIGTTQSAAFFTAAADDENDPRESIRVLDFNPTLLADADSGTICLTGVEITAFSRSSLQVAETFNAPIDNATHFAVVGVGTGTGTIDDATDTMSITVGPDASIVQFGYFDGTLGNPRLQLNPMVWTGGSLYRVFATLSAPGGDGPEIKALNGQSSNSEIGVIDFSHDGGVGGDLEGSTDLTASPERYEQYLYGQSETLSATLDANRLRMSPSLINRNDIREATNGVGTATVTDVGIERLVTP